MLFDLVNQNMGCLAVLGSCGIIKDCSGACKLRFGPNTVPLCDHDGAAGACVCTYPCPTDKTHM